MRKPIRILLVDDEILPAMLMQAQLKALGYGSTGIATTGAKAIQSARLDPPDLILMDIRLAGEMDGIDAATAILSDLSIPVIFVTGYEDQGIRERASRLDPLAYLIKPVETHGLERIIAGYFSGDPAPLEG